VEGKNDHKYIKKILQKFNQVHELDRNDISFIEYEGKYNLHKIDSSLIDAALKAGGGEIETLPVSCLFIRDKDESVEKLEENDNLMILSVREIENTVISESSIRGVVSDIIGSLDIDNFDFEVFENQLVTCVQGYLNRWVLLKLRNSIESVIRPLLRRRAIESYDMITDELANTEVNGIRAHIEEVLKDLEIEHEQKSFEHIHTQLSELCFHNETTIDYEFICRELPGKDLFHLIKDALVQTIFSSIANGTLSEEYLRSKIGDMCRFDSFLHHTTELPEDIRKFVERIKSL